MQHPFAGIVEHKYLLSSGGMNAENFVKWMEHLISHAKPSADDPLLLILDNHIKHMLIEAIQLAKNNQIIMTIFPPPTTNMLQLLDVAVYGPLKSHYHAVCNS